MVGYEANQTIGTGSHSLGRSAQTDWDLDGANTEGSSFSVNKTAYTHDWQNIGSNEYLSMFSSTHANNVNYWIASRCIDFDETANEANYNVYVAGYSGVNSNVLYRSNDTSEVQSNVIRPVVEIDMTNLKVGETGAGTIGAPYRIEEK